MNRTLQTYLSDLSARGLSKSLRTGSSYAVEWLAIYLKERWNITDWREVKGEHLDGFALFLRRNHLTRQKQRLKESTVNRVLSLVRSFFAWQHRRGLLLWNPAEQLSSVLYEQSLPRVLNETEISRLIETPDIEKAIGLRDRALMEVLYATGIRHVEAHGLDLYDADAAGRRLIIRKGKNNRDRVVPLTENAAFWLSEYLAKSRPELWRRAARHNESAPLAPSVALWLSNAGRRLSYSSIDQNIAKYALAAEVKACVHTFRHSCASHLLRGGADIRHIQKLLGHRDLSATQIYLHLEISDLKRVVSKLR